jgi:hypothetical protein
LEKTEMGIGANLEKHGLFPALKAMEILWKK